MRQLNEAWIPMLAISTLGLPGLSVPAGFVEGVPVGVQIVADRFQEERCFAAAEVIEAAYPTKIP
jgi:amidase